MLLLWGEKEGKKKKRQSKEITSCVWKVMIEILGDRNHSRHKKKGKSEYFSVRCEINGQRCIILLLIFTGCLKLN